MASQWYVYKDGQQIGPYSFEQLAGVAKSGRLGPSDMVWVTGMEGWTRADQVEGLHPTVQNHSGTASPQLAALSNNHNAPATEVKLEQLSKWMGFVGTITIIGGALSAISGVFALVIGAIPGIVTIILGVMLRKAKKYADALLYEGAADRYSENFIMFVGSLNTYFKIMGILIIIGLILGVLGAIFGLIAGFAFTNYLETLELF